MTVITRTSWGSATPEYDRIATRDLAIIDVAIVHYADAPPPDDPSQAHDEAHDAAAGEVRAIQTFHMQTRGWADIAYHRLIAPDGAIYAGRDLSWVGAHAKGANEGSIGYCFLTNADATDEAWNAFLRQLQEDEGAVGRQLRVAGHRDVTPTSCPGDAIYARVHGGAPPADHPSQPPAPTHPEECSTLPPGPPPAGHHLITPRSSHADVAWLQSRLAEHGFEPGNSRRANGEFDGIWGEHTSASLHGLQAKFNLHFDEAAGRQVYCVFGIR